MPSAALPSEPIAFSRVGGLAQTSESSEDLPSNSVEQIRSIEMYQPTRPQRVSSLGEIDPRPSPVSSSASCSGVGIAKEDDPAVPFPKLPGEFVRYFGRMHKGDLYVTTYRLFVFMDDKRRFWNIPLTTVDSVEARDMFILQINCKDGRVFKVSSENSENSLAWFKLLTTLSASPRKTDDLFAIAFRAWCKSCDLSGRAVAPLLRSLDVYTHDRTDDNEHCRSLSDARRLGFEDTYWRVSNANRSFELCETYPRKLLVPHSITDEDLKQARAGRFLYRLPAVVWRCREKGTVLLRSSQPRVGLFSWRNTSDEKFIEHVLLATAKQPSAAATHAANGHVSNGSVDDSHLLATVKSMLILDARSYTAAWANRAKGGGFESTEYYQKTELQFMGLPNIHNIRYSFQQLRQLLTSQIDQTTYFQSLQATQWFLHLSNLMSSSLRCVDALVDEGRSVLVHCSDGWDRTTQIVCLAKLIADPHYRTMTGFKELIEREWIDFGHKFADRVGLLNSDPNERSPVFLQWLDCVYQLYEQFPCAFEFNQLYLAKLAQHVYASLFGTFLANSAFEADRNKLQTRTFSIWQYLHPDNPLFRNVIYEPHEHIRLRPNVGVQHLHLWRQVYCSGPHEPSNLAQDDARARNASTTTELERSLTKAHSCDSLTNVDGTLGTSPPSGVIVHSQSGSERAGALMVRSGSDSSIPSTIGGGSLTDAAAARNVIDDMVSRVSFDDDVHHSPLVHVVEPLRRPQQPDDAFDSPDSQLGMYPTPIVVKPVCNGMATLHGRQEMNTSTSEISDSLVAAKYFAHMANGLKQSFADNGRHKSVRQPVKAKRRRRFERIEDALDADGLTNIEDALQERMRELNLEHERRVNALENELQRFRRLFREQQTTLANCRRCSENGDVGHSAGSKASLDDGMVFEPRSVESLASDVSWDAVDETDELPTKWIPDHAVSHCMGCDTAFWTINRKHHCRSCGKVFCSACTNYECAVPKEQLYEPVRVCQQCFKKLKDQRVVTNNNDMMAANGAATPLLVVAGNGQAVVG
uniref:Lateral signaling target protein 2 homolog n=1 Tax=Plectus sambesii TaxID=2011161 RepID=A0A914XA33_9BILA